MLFGGVQHVCKGHTGGTGGGDHCQRRLRAADAERAVSRHRRQCSQCRHCPGRRKPDTAQGPGARCICETEGLVLRQCDRCGKKCQMSTAPILMWRASQGHVHLATDVDRCGRINCLGHRQFPHNVSKFSGKKGMPSFFSFISFLALKLILISGFRCFNLKSK